MLTGLQLSVRDLKLSELLPLSHVCKTHSAAAWVNGGGQEEFLTH